MSDVLKSLADDLAAVKGDLSDARAALALVGGALCDSGLPVPEEAKYGEAVRELVAQLAAAKAEVEHAKAAVHECKHCISGRDIADAHAGERAAIARATAAESALASLKAAFLERLKPLSMREMFERDPAAAVRFWDEQSDSFCANAQARAIALEELVTLKDGPRDAEYERRKPLAWERARAAILHAGEPASRPLAAAIARAEKAERERDAAREAMKGEARLHARHYVRADAAEAALAAMTQRPILSDPNAAADPRRVEFMPGAVPLGSTAGEEMAWTEVEKEVERRLIAENKLKAAESALAELKGSLASANDKALMRGRAAHEAQEQLRTATARIAELEVALREARGPVVCCNYGGATSALIARIDAALAPNAPPKVEGPDFVPVPRLDFERLLDALSKALAHEQRLCASDLIGTGHSHSILRLLRTAMEPFDESRKPKLAPTPEGTNG